MQFSKYVARARDGEFGPVYNSCFIRKLSGCRMNEKITLRNLSTEKAFSKNVGPHVSMKNPGPRAHCP